MLINGKITNEIAATDRGLAYGDGLFSTIKVEYGIVLDWSLHLARLQLGAERLFFPVVDWILLQQEVFASAKSIKDQPHYVLKVILTRGSGGRGYSVQGCESPNRIVSLSPFPKGYLQWQKEGIAIIKCETLLGRNKQLAGLKSLARLEQVLIKQELAVNDAVEGLVLDERGNVIEGCAANLFLFLNDQWYTPSLSYSGVAGVMRARILDHNALNVIVKEITLDEVKQASCMCLTNALMGIVPVKQFQDKIYTKKQQLQVVKLQLILNREVIEDD